MEAVFLASGNEFSIEFYSLRPVQTEYRVIFLPLLQPFSTHFVYIYIYKHIYIYKYVYLPVQAVFRHSENIFLTNPSFQLVEAEFLFSGNSIL